MPTLLLRLEGPMQSWGTSSRFDERDTGLEPSKSGVIGLLCAALGRDRAKPVDDLAALVMGVRVDREGIPRRDFQTATGVMLAKGTADKSRTVVSPRFYLSDASFLVGLEGEDASLLERVDNALAAPVWPLFLGRKSFVPSLPVRLEQGGLRQAPLVQALLDHPLVRSTASAEKSAALRFVLESGPEGSMRMDQPLGSFAERCFGPRRVISEVRHVSVQVAA